MIAWRKIKYLLVRLLLVLMAQATAPAPTESIGAKLKMEQVEKVCSIKKKISGDPFQFVLYVRKHKPKGVEVFFPHISEQEFFRGGTFCVFLFSILKNKGVVSDLYTPLKRGPPQV